MARQVLPIVGYAIGAYFGGPWGAAIGQAIGTVVGNAVDPLIIDGPKIGDVAQQTSSEGVYQPIYFGTTQGAGNIIAQGPNVIRKRRQSQGKGGGPITVTETLYKTFAIRIGVSWTGEEGITGISRIWENGKLVYDTREGSTILPESANFQTKFRLYLGTADQAPDPALEAIYGVGNTPSYRGRAYIVFPLYDITQWRAIPQYSFEVVTGGGSVPAYDTMMSGTRAGLADDNGYAAISADPEDWIPVPHSALGFSGIPVFCEDRWVMVTNTQCAYTDDLTGQSNWIMGTVESGANTLTSAKYLGSGRILAAGLSNTIMLSVDKGETFTLVELPGTANHQTIVSNTLGDAIIGSGSNTNHLYTQNGAASFAMASSPATSYSLDAGYYRYDQEGWYVGGGSSNPSGPGEIARLASPSATPVGVVNDAPSKIVAMAYRSWDHIDGFLGVAICFTGEILYTVDDWLTYTVSSFVLPDFTNTRPFVYDGQRFIIGYSGGVGEDASVFWFTDPEVVNGPYLDTLQDNFAIETSFMGVVQVSAEPPTLDQVVSTIHTYCGQSASEYDVSLLSDIIVRGLVLAGAYTGKDAINTLQQLWMIDSPEYEKKIHYRKRGANVVETLTFDDLIDEPEDATREQVIEYPKKLHLDYQSPVVDYAPAKATSSRSSIDARVVGEISIQVPVVLTANEAFQRTAVLHKVSWADADGEVVFSVPDQYLALVPGDCVSLFIRGTLRRLRIDRIEYYPGRLKLTCRGDRQSAYTSNVEGLTPPPPTPPPPSIVGPTMLIVGDWPALRDQDDQTVPVKYFAMGGTNEAWHGALGEQSLDGGTSYSEILEVYSGAVMGTLQEGISDAAPYFADHTNTVVVQLDLDEFEIDSLTESQFLSENGGFALVKPDNTFELMQYRDAVDMGEGLYELSYLQRGRLNSETHAFEAGDRFVLLSTVAVVPASTAQIGMDVYHRATSFGQTTEDGTVVNDVYEGNSQREWPVAHVLLEKSGDTINGTIVPRHRFGTEVNPIRSINWTNYEITFQDSVDQFETVIQTADTFSYDASAMTFPVTVTVYQVNRITGAGPGKSEVIE